MDAAFEFTALHVGIVIHKLLKPGVSYNIFSTDSLINAKFDKPSRITITSSTGEPQGRVLSFLLFAS